MSASAILVSTDWGLDVIDVMESSEIHSQPLELVLHPSICITDVEKAIADCRAINKNHQDSMLSVSLDYKFYTTSLDDDWVHHYSCIVFVPGDNTDDVVLVSQRLENVMDDGDELESDVFDLCAILEYLKSKQ